MTTTGRMGRAAAALLTAAGLAGLGACNFDSPPGAVEPTIEARRVPLRDAFELDTNERVGVEDSDLRVSFLDVRNDSRCPSDAQCPTAGDAIVQLAVSTLEAQKTIELHTAGPRSRDLGGYLFELVELEPEPVSDEDIDHDDYEVTLRITPTGGGE